MSLIVRLNGSNYVSDKTKTTFEKSLDEGAQIAGKGISESQSPVALAASHPKPSRSAPAPLPAAPVPLSGRVFDGLERGLTQSFEHQKMTLQVHEQYLNYQSDYATIFSQLMEQQGAIFAKANGSSQQAEASARVLTSLSQSMGRFHDLQSETLGVHKQFLNQQSEYTQAYVKLLEGQQKSAVPGNGGGNGYHHASIMPAKAVEYFQANVAPVQIQESPASSPPVVSVAAAPRVDPAPAPEPHPVASVPTAMDFAALEGALLAIVSDKTGYPAEMLEVDMDMEADLGIDSIKRVEIMGALQDQHPDLPAVETEALAELRTLAQILEHVQASMTGTSSNAHSALSTSPAPVSQAPAAAASAQPEALDAKALEVALLDIVSDKTGYPAEMLEVDMDMEADLGIDSIKRVEIMGALQDQHPDLPTVETEALAELRTLAQILEYVGTRELVEKKV